MWILIKDAHRIWLAIYGLVLRRLDCMTSSELERNIKETAVALLKYMPVLKKKGWGKPRETLVYVDDNPIEM